MTRFVYPRLPFYAAERIVDEIAGSFDVIGIDGLEQLVAFEHDRAEPVATGGRVADADQIESVRGAVVAATAPWRDRGSVNRAEAASFDLALGRALHDSLRIVPADAAHDETWNFLSLVVMPDVVVLRFPDMHPDRMFGTLRNPLRSSWVRRDTLGDLTDGYAKPLGVDEMVGLFERSEMARNRSLIRALARAVMEYQGPVSRSDWARRVFKEIRYMTGPRALDGMTEGEITALIHRDQRRHGGADVEADRAAPHSARLEPVGQLDSADLNRKFHRAMVALYERAKTELGYNATYLARMIASDGAVATARRLLMSESAPDGFTYLWEHKRLDLSVEALVLDEDFRPLFDDVMLERAKRRLDEFGWR